MKIYYVVFNSYKNSYNISYAQESISVSPNLCHQKADVTSKAVVEVINKTSEYLQPNPATRAKLSMLSTVSKIRGQGSSPGYPQPEELLGECMIKYGHEMGGDNNFGENDKAIQMIKCKAEGIQYIVV